MHLMNLVATVATTASTSGVLDTNTLQVITEGFSTLQGTVTQVLAVSVPASVGIIALTGGVRYALKKVRGVIASAA